MATKSESRREMLARLTAMRAEPVEPLAVYELVRNSLGRNHPEMDAASVNDAVLALARANRGWPTEWLTNGDVAALVSAAARGYVADSVAGRVRRYGCQEVWTLETSHTRNKDGSWSTGKVRGYWGYASLEYEDGEWTAKVWPKL